MRPATSALEAWGGAECTVNRTGDRYRDQIEATGLDGELALEAVASLGLDAFRLPVLWERVRPSPGTQPAWGWSDRWLAGLRARGIRPIVGLLHHGSGPAHTSLLDYGFALGLAAFAGEVAQRYPWVVDWTPVNEPLTTARFSALYGIWYPHERDERSFWTALLNQIDATRLAMRAIREVQPAARLVQTEDLGRTYATAGLAGQAAFDNQRRWMTWDLLCGRVDPGHPLWDRLCGFGFERRLWELLDDTCPPDVIGIDHYLTSDRLLDHRLAPYPEAARGGNGRQAYCDVAAIRVLDPAPQGLAGALREAWARYRLPIALTEVHNGCTREEQVRWLDEAWAVARQAKAEGVDVRAVTAWALFGSQGWNTLLTDAGVYEPGAFDVSGEAPRETALAQAVRARGEGPGIGGSGWWRREVRLSHGPAARAATLREHSAPVAEAGAAPILITGATGTLGRALAAECAHRDLACVLTSRGELDLDDPDGIARALEKHRPWAVVNAAGWVRVDDAEDRPEDCFAANADGATALVTACAARGIRTLSFSSDLVFDGGKTSPYREHDAVNPLNAYGRSKGAMEAGLASLPGTNLVVRTAAFFSPFDRHNFAIHCLRALARGADFAASADCVVSPTYVPDLSRTALDLLIDGERGIWHLTNSEAVSWHTFARRLALAAGLNARKVVAASATGLGWRAARPAYVPLEATRGARLPSLESAIARFVAESGPWREATEAGDQDRERAAA